MFGSKVLKYKIISILKGIKNIGQESKINNVIIFVCFNDFYVAYILGASSNIIIFNFFVVGKTPDVLEMATNFT